MASAGAGANPFVASVTPAPQAAPSQAAFRAEAAALTANLLSSAGVQGFQIVSEIPKELSTFHSVWTAPGLVGGVFIDPSHQADENAATITAHRARDCKGKFGVVKLPVTADGASLKTICETSPGKAEGETYLLLPRQGGVYVLTIFEVNDGAPDNAPSTSAQTAGTNAEVTSGRLMEASIRVLGR